MLFGPVGVLGKEEVGGILVARVNGVVDVKDLEANSEIFTWFRDGVAIQDSDKVTYHVKEEDAGKTLRVQYSFRTRDKTRHNILSRKVSIADPQADYWKYLYNKYLNRDPDEEGLKWWRNRVEVLFKNTLE